MEKAYGASGLCYRYMHATIEPFRDMLPPLPSVDLPAALLQFFVEHADMDEYKLSAMRDGIDGKIDDHRLLEILIKQLEELLGATFVLLMKLKDQRK